jgi:arginase
MNGSVALVAVPYELGRLREGVGCGPEHLLQHGAADALRSAGADVRVRTVELDPRFNATGSGEGDAAFELIRQVAAHVKSARDDGAFPVILSGSCFAGVGVVAGLAERVPGVVWFDSHADFNEPATTTEGYIDGMGLAILTGSAWQGMLAGVPDARPVPESHVVLAAARSIDPPEEIRLRASSILQLSADRLRSPAGLLAALSGLSPAMTGLYVHIDLDVLDASVAQANLYTSSGGLAGDDLAVLVSALFESFPVRAVSLTAYDPGFDREDRVPPIAVRVLRAVADARRPGARPSVD